MALPPSSPKAPELETPVEVEREERARVSGEVPSDIVLEEGTLLADKYRLTRTAGFGGMAQLWVAQNEATGAEVCIKVLVPQQSDDESVQRFRREAHAAARLSHRAIVRVFDLVELDASGRSVPSGGKVAALGIVMELLHGETLSEYIMKKGRLELDEAIDLAVPFLSALAHAHRAGVVHRDVKPDNIFLSTDPDGHVTPKVLDFGVSKVHAPDVEPLTFDGVMLGTPSFMSPEQARGARSVDARSDVFSAGIVLYMMLSGTNPFESERFHTVINAILWREPPPILGVPEGIWMVIAKALEKDPEARYADATELGIALRKAAGRRTATESGVHSVPRIPGAAEAGHSSAPKLVTPLGGDSILTVPPASEPEQASDRGDPLRRQLTVRILGAVAAAAVVIAFVSFWRSSRPSDEPRTAGGVQSTQTVPAVATTVATEPAAAPVASATTSTDAGAAATPRPTAPANKR